MYEANLGGVFRLYRAALPRCWPAAAVLALGGAALGVALGRMMPTTDDPWLWATQVRSLLLTGAYWRIVLLGGAVSMLCYGALVAVVHSVAVPATPAPAAGGFPVALRALPAALVAAVIFLVVTTLGTMAFFIPGAWLWGMWQLWLVALIVERLGPIAALRRSWQLMIGAWWRITTLITIVLIVIFALAVVAYLIAGAMLLVVGMNLERTTAVMTVLEALGNLLLAPLVVAAFVVAYLDRQQAQALVRVA
jgi:hypothetical protein